MKELQGTTYDKRMWREDVSEISWFGIRQLILYAVIFLSGRFSIAGVYPLVPAAFMTGIMAGLNRGIVFLCAVAGMIAFVPVAGFVKYGLALVAALVMVSVTERFFHKCRADTGGLLMALATVVMSLAGSLMEIRTGSTLPAGILEGVFIFGFVQLLSVMCFRFLEWKPFAVRGEDKEEIQTSLAEPRLNSYADSFARLSRAFQGMERYREDFSAEELSRMQRELTGRVCGACGRCSICWNSEQTKMYQILYEFLQRLHQGEEMDKCSTALSANCLRSTAMMEETVRVFERARLNMAWYNRLLENREVIAQQLGAMAYIMKDCAKSYENVGRREGRMQAAIKFKLKEMGVAVQELRLLRGPAGKLELYVKGYSRHGNCISLRDLAKELSKAADCPLTSVRENRTLLGKDTVIMRFREDTAFCVTQGMAKLTKGDEQISGDNYSFQQLEDGRFVMSLSDGMGCGVQACKESEMVIDLIEKFLEAGFEEETAIRMMNSAMVTHGENNLFSTVDLSVLDLDQGTCSLFKSGGATTFIRRKDEVECISSTNLPVGVFPRLEIEKSKKQLEDGDFVVMVSDGVLDHLHVENPNQEVAQIIRETDTNHPGKMARKILERVLLYTGGEVRDDMTVLICGIWKKKR